MKETLKKLPLIMKVMMVIIFVWYGIITLIPFLLIGYIITRNDIVYVITNCSVCAMTLLMAVMVPAMLSWYKRRGADEYLDDAKIVLDVLSDDKYDDICDYAQRNSDNRYTVIRLITAVDATAFIVLMFVNMQHNILHRWIMTTFMIVLWGINFAVRRYMERLE